MDSLTTHTGPADKTHNIRRTFSLNLTNIIQDIERIIPDSGNTFIQLSSHLQRLHHESEAMGKLSLSNREGETLTQENLSISDTGEFAKTILSGLQEQQKNNQDLLLRISDTISVIKKLLKRSESISNLGGQLEIIGINLAIQTTRHEQGAETFGDFSSEIKGFSAYTRKFADEIQQDAVEVIRVLTDVKNQLETKMAYMSNFILQAEQDSQKTLTEIEHLGIENTKASIQTAEHAKQISHTVNEAIVSLQIDDITRQRLEHIKDALKNARPDQCSIEESLAVTEIQQHQLREVSHIIHESENDIRSEFVSIGNEVKQIDRLLKANRQDGNGTTTSLLKLRATLEDLARVQSEAMSVRHSIAASLDIAIVASERVSRHIGNVSIITQELNLKAINAILMSRDLGSTGNNLVVLAKELHSLSKDSINYVDDLKHTIEHVDLVTKALKENTSKETAKDDTDAAFSTNVTIIDNHIDHITETAKKSHRLCHEVERLIEEVISDVNNITDVSDRISQCEEKLKENIRDMKSQAGDSGIMNEDIHDRLYQQYTMEEERKIHRNIRGEDTVSTNGSIQPSQPPSQDDDFGDFELF